MKKLDGDILGSRYLRECSGACSRVHLVIGCSLARPRKLCNRRQLDDLLEEGSIGRPAGWVVGVVEEHQSGQREDVGRNGVPRSGRNPETRARGHGVYVGARRRCCWSDKTGYPGSRTRLDLAGGSSTASGECAIPSFEPISAEDARYSGSRSMAYPHSCRRRRSSTALSSIELPWSRKRTDGTRGFRHDAARCE